MPLVYNKDQTPRTPKLQKNRTCWRFALVLTAAALLAATAEAHPGSGIVVDRHGQVYFVDTGSGVWKIDAHGKLTRVPGPAFHWMTIDPDDRFGKVRLPSGRDWEIARAGSHPTLLLASDFPIAMGRNGNLYYPLFEAGSGLRILLLAPSGQTSVLTSLPTEKAKEAKEELRWINGLATAPDGTLYYTENKAIRRITAHGISTVSPEISPAGCVSIPGMESKEGPLLRGLAVDSRGTVYVAATGCGSVLKIAPDGKVTTLFQLQSPWSPTGVALFGGDLYVLEYLHTASDNRREWLPRVRKISPDGRTVLIAAIDRR